MNSPEQNQIPKPEKQEQSMKEIVLAEMEQFKNEFPQKHPHIDPKRWRVFFFGNFWLNILDFRKKQFKKTGILDDYPETRQFFEDIDKTMDELNLDKKELIELWENSNPDSDYKKFLDTVFDLYIHLREKGYKHYPDLVA